MKTTNLILQLTVLLILPSLGQATDLIHFDGRAQVVQEDVTAEVTHTEYRTETVPDTCYRSVFAGYESVCHTERATEVCGITPTGRQCNSVPGREVCSQEARYRDEMYSCSREIQVPYQVKDYDVLVHAHVEIPTSADGLNETVRVYANGTGAFLQAHQTSKKVLIYQSVRNEQVSFSNGLMVINSFITVSFADLVQLTNPLLVGMSPLSVEKGRYLTFTTGQILEPELVAFSLEVTRDRFYGLFGKSRLLNRKLTSKEFSVEDNGNSLSRIRIDLRHLGITEKIKDKKINLAVRTDLSIATDGLVNRADLSKSATQKMKHTMGK